MSADEPALAATNTGYRYGDGLFETIKVVNGKAALADLHFNRLFDGMRLLGFRVPVLLTRESLLREILSLCKDNGCEQLARVRLSVSRGQGGLYDDPGPCQYLVECWPLEQAASGFNENGLVIGIFPQGQKSVDDFSRLKSANFLLYSVAARFAKAQRWNDAVVLNTNGTVADSTIANLFIVKDGKIKTPSLQQGPIAGVMRAYLLKHLEVEEGIVSTDELQEADEVFLTNAIRGIRWVQQLGNKQYSNTFARQLFRQLVQTAW